MKAKFAVQVCRRLRTHKYLDEVENYYWEE